MTLDDLERLYRPRG